MTIRSGRAHRPEPGQWLSCCCATPAPLVSRPASGHEETLRGHLVGLCGPISFRPGSMSHHSNSSNTCDSCSCFGRLRACRGAPRPRTQANGVRPPAGGAPEPPATRAGLAGSTEEPAGACAHPVVAGLDLGRVPLLVAVIGPPVLALLSAHPPQRLQAPRDGLDHCARVLVVGERVRGCDGSDARISKVRRTKACHHCSACGAGASQGYTTNGSYKGINTAANARERGLGDIVHGLLSNLFTSGRRLVSVAKQATKFRTAPRPRAPVTTSTS